MVIYINQQLSNIRFMKKLSNTEAELKKALLIKKCIYWMFPPDLLQKFIDN